MSSVRMPERTETTDQLPLYVPRPPLPTSYSNLPPLETEQGTYSTPPSYTDAIKGTEPQSNPIVDSNLTEVPLTTTITIPETSYYPENVPERNHSVGVAVQ
ncbi:hypothetical protein BGZ76_009942 [Entomortierella beljakovae]|nr:hypothetical protein BGZ76_009942 [Entomortierella beljakovae]